MSVPDVAGGAANPYKFMVCPWHFSIVSHIPCERVLSCSSYNRILSSRFLTCLCIELSMKAPIGCERRVDIRLGIPSTTGMARYAFPVMSNAAATGLISRAFHLTSAARLTSGECQYDTVPLLRGLNLRVEPPKVISTHALVAREFVVTIFNCCHKSNWIGIPSIRQH